MEGSCKPLNVLHQDSKYNCKNKRWDYVCSLSETKNCIQLLSFCPICDHGTLKNTPNTNPVRHSLGRKIHFNEVSFRRYFEICTNYPHVHEKVKSLPLLLAQVFFVLICLTCSVSIDMSPASASYCFVLSRPPLPGRGGNGIKETWTTDFNRPDVLFISVARVSVRQAGREHSGAEYEGELSDPSVPSRLYLLAHQTRRN